MLEIGSDAFINKTCAISAAIDWSGESMASSKGFPASAEIGAVLSQKEDHVHVSALNGKVEGRSTIGGAPATAISFGVAAPC